MFDKIIGNVKGIFNKITLLELFISIIYIMIGLVIFTNSKMSDSLVSILVGILLITNGLSSIYAFIKRRDIVLFNNNIMYGLVLIILGLLALFLKNVLVIIVGIYFIIIGIQKMNYGLILKRFKESSWLITFVIGLFLVIVSIISIIEKNKKLVEIVGICILFYGLMNLIDVIILRKRSHYFLK